jgi:hypothetical protein
MSLDFRMLKIQTALFLSTLDFTDRLSLAVAIREASDGKLDGEPVILPVPDDAPAEIPRLRLNSLDGTRACQVTPQRLDFLFERTTEQVNQDESSDIMQTHLKLTTDVWEQLQETFNARAHRIGLISRIGARVPDANALLREAFLRTDGFDLSNKLEVHALHKLRMNQYDVNRWVRLRAFKAQSDEEEYGHLVMEVDINTLPEHQIDLSTETVTRFFQEALSLLEKTRQTFVLQIQEG